MKRFAVTGCRTRVQHLVNIDQNSGRLVRAPSDLFQSFFAFAPPAHICEPFASAFSFHASYSADSGIGEHRVYRKCGVNKRKRRRNFLLPIWFSCVRWQQWPAMYRKCRHEIRWSGCLCQAHKSRGNTSFAKYNVHIVRHTHTHYSKMTWNEWFRQLLCSISYPGIRWNWYTRTKTRESRRKVCMCVCVYRL